MKNLIILLTLIITSFGIAQNDLAEKQDSIAIKNIYNQSLSDGMAYKWLDHLTNEIGGRLSGSANAQKAVEWGAEEMGKLGLEVKLQPVMVPHWIRGEKEYAFIFSKGEKIEVPICALGFSVATPLKGLSSRLVEVHSIEELDSLGEEKIKGRIVFFNRPMDQNLINTFKSYGGCVDQRSSGAREAGKYGAVGVIVRSMSLRLDDYPHTGSMNYGDTPEEERIPAAAISTNGAEMLSKMLKEDADLRFFFRQNCKNLPDAPSFNVIGELKGTEFPDEIIVVGGHLDSWDLGTGAHDDGAGIVQSMDVARNFLKLGIKPKRTLRVVLFMNEENGQRGAIKYAEEAEMNMENHVFALESDSGGFTPRGFSFQFTKPEYFEHVRKWNELFEPYLVHLFVEGGSGADVRRLGNDSNIMAGYRPDSQRYFDYHHTSIDTFDAVNKRELELGSATMSSLVYLIDKYGIKQVENLKH